MSTISNQTVDITYKKINQDKFMVDIFYGEFDGNLTKCATGLGISYSSLVHFVKTGKLRSHVLPNAIVKYCRERQQNPENYFLTT